MITTNSVQNAIDVLVGKWQNAYTSKGIRLVCITYTQKEESMIDAFLQYILALDNSIKNFVWVFESVFEDQETFAISIAEEMETVLQNWNSMTKPAEYADSEINWHPVLNNAHAENPMQLLVQNLNDFAAHLFPNKDMKVCYVFRNYDISKTEAYEWIKSSFDCVFEKNVSWTVLQTTENPIYKKVISNFPYEVKEVKSDIDVNAVVEQLAAQGDPSKRENVYRSELVKLMHAVEERDKDKVSIQSKKCLDIILGELKKDANWIAQVVTVYVILYNDQIGYKNYNEALYFSDKAIEAAVISQQTMDASLGNRLAGQAYMGRASIQVLKGNWEAAHNDYVKAKEAYEQCNDYLMQIESCRLCGWTSRKFEQEEKSIPFYVEGFNLHKKIDAQTLKNSGFTLMLKEVIYNNTFERLVTRKVLDEVLIPLFGANYNNEIANYGTAR